jgi:hypothetical protein
MHISVIKNSRPYRPEQKIYGLLQTPINKGLDHIDHIDHINKNIYIIANNGQKTSQKNK